MQGINSNIDDSEKQLAKERLLEMLKKVWSRTKDIPEEVIEKDIEEAIRVVRASKTDNSIFNKIYAKIQLQKNKERRD